MKQRIKKVLEKSEMFSWYWKYYINNKKNRHSYYKRFDKIGNVVCQGQYNNGIMFGVWKGIIEVSRYKQQHIYTTKEVYHGIEIMFNKNFK